MTLKGTLRDAIISLIPGQLPHDDGLLPRGQYHVRELGSGGDLGYPAVVALEDTTKYLLSYGGGECKCRCGNKNGVGQLRETSTTAAPAAVLLRKRA